MSTATTPPTEPAIRAPYAPPTLSAEATSASEGRAKKYANFERTPVSETIIRIAPTTNASTNAATVVTTSTHGRRRRRFPEPVEEPVTFPEPVEGPVAVPEPVGGLVLGAELLPSGSGPVGSGPVGGVTALLT